MGMRIGIDLGGTKMEGVLMDDAGNVVCRERVSTPSDYFNMLVEITKLVRLLDKQSQETCPVGLGTPGAWNEASKSMKNCNSTCLNGRPFFDDIQRALARPVRIENDANCFVLSEAVDGAGKDAHCVFGVILGTGVGGGWVVDGKLLKGPNGISGEWGHNPIPNLRQDPKTYEQEQSLADRQCYCGRMNCVEAFLSGPGLAKTHRELTGEEATAETIAEWDSSPTLELYSAMLARALAIVVNVVDPDVIVLGGGVSNIRSLYRDLPEKLHQYACNSEGKTEIRQAEHEDSSGVRGAAWLF